MASKWGERHGLPGYDKFRTGMSYRTVWGMLRNESEDSSEWKYKRRGTILGMWHQAKLELYNRAVDEGLLDDGNADTVDDVPMVQKDRMLSNVRPPHGNKYSGKRVRKKSRNTATKLQKNNRMQRTSKAQLVRKAKTT